MPKGNLKEAIFDDNTYRYAWHGGKHAFRGILANRSDTKLGKSIPFCLGNFLGNLIEEITEGMGQEKFLASVHIPVKARYGGDPALKEHMLHIELECDIACRDAAQYDEDDDFLTGTAYADGCVKITKLVGPLAWRSETWAGMTLCFAPLDRAVNCMAASQPEGGGA